MTTSVLPFALHWTYGLFYSIIHALPIAFVSTDLYVIAQLKPKCICTTPRNLLDFVSGRPKHWECPLTGRNFVGGKGTSLLVNEGLYLFQEGLKLICCRCLFFAKGQ